MSNFRENAFEQLGFSNSVPMTDEKVYQNITILPQHSDPLTFFIYHLIKIVNETFYYILPVGLTMFEHLAFENFLAHKLYSVQCTVLYWYCTECRSGHSW